MNEKRYMHCMIVQDIPEDHIFNSEIKILYVIIGQVQVYIGCECYNLKRSDIIVLNPGTEYFFKCDVGSVSCVVSYAGQLLSSLFPQWKQMKFKCNSAIEPEGAYSNIRRLFKELVGVCIAEDSKNECEKRSLLYKMLGCLTKEFIVKKANGESVFLHDEDDRLQQMYQYIDQNFQTGINLSDLAERLYTSTSTLSRIFKKSTGMYFTEYVNKVRMDYAVGELEYSDESITRIAVDSGFSNLSVFNRVFKDTFGVSPSEYRKLRKTKEEKTEYGQEELMSRLREELRGDLLEADIVPISVDALAKEKYHKFWNQTINVGSLNTLLMANTQYHVVYLVENLGFKYVRIWNIFSTQMKVTDGIHIGNYSYDQIDIALDFLDKHNIIPFLDFGVRPSAAVKNEKVNVYYGEECVEFATREVWENLITDFLRHVVKRYGKEKVSKWIFELSYDVSHKKECYKDGEYDFFHAYQYLYNTVKGIVPLAEVGGPMAIVHCSEMFLREFFQKSKENDCVPDFVSILLFPYITYLNGEEVCYRTTKDSEYEIHEIERIRLLMVQSGITSKLYVSEWNNTLSSRNYLNDSCYRSAYFTYKVMEMWDRVDMINVWMASDWVSNYFDVGGVANGGNGLLTKDTICKPAYYALQFLNQLREYLLAKGRNYIITRSEQQDYYIVCSNYKSLGGEYFLKDELTEDPKILQIFYEDESVLELEITLQNMRADRYVVKKRTVNPKEGSFLWEWGKFNYDSSLSIQDIKYIRQISLPRISMKKCDALEGRLILREKIGPQETILIHIYEE